MRTLQLLTLPLIALTFALFIYWLAVTQITPKPDKKNLVRILPLQIVEQAARTEISAIIGNILTEPPPETAKNSSAGDEITGDSTTNVSVNVKISMFNKKPFNNDQYRFIPTDRIYLVLDLENLEAGRHQISASWINPDGKTISRADHSIDLESPASRHRSYFWLELMKNGAFTEMITGKEYKGNIYGRWHVQIHLDDQHIAEKSFNMQDT
ncbi:MAG: hypothetical protein EHM86_08695 [Desulfobulbaceae bacterium]|nr:MAG: hypothetical protein EHM86_08695 [Desulfobulbaceae bacterium]